MKTNWKLQDKPIEFDEMFKEVIEMWMKKLQDDIDKEILDRYEWDWEFRNSVDKIMEERKNEI